MKMDQTGQFSVTSSQGNKYEVIAVELNSNYVDVEQCNHGQHKNCKGSTDYLEAMKRYRSHQPKVAHCG